MNLTKPRQFLVTHHSHIDLQNVGKYKIPDAPKEACVSQFLMI